MGCTPVIHSGMAKLYSFVMANSLKEHITVHDVLQTLASAFYERYIFIHGPHDRVVKAVPRGWDCYVFGDDLEFMMGSLQQEAPLWFMNGANDVHMLDHVIGRTTEDECMIKTCLQKVRSVGGIEM
jgi:hypothetical protein